MTTATLPAPPTKTIQPSVNPDIPPFPVFRFSVQQYFQMIDGGIFAPDDRIELIQGWVVPKMGKKSPHIYATLKLRRLLDALKIADVFFNSENPVVLSDSVPEPDGMAVRGTPEDYKRRLVTAADVPFVAEVAASTLEFDRTHKQQIFAAAQIPIYWVINLEDEQVEVYSDPTGPDPDPRYLNCRVYNRNEDIPVVIDGVEVGRIAVRELLT